jgi:hypothetical protein
MDNRYTAMRFERQECEPSAVDAQLTSRKANTDRRAHLRAPGATNLRSRWGYLLAAGVASLAAMQFPRHGCEFLPP